MKKRRTAAEVQELLKTPPPPEHIEAYREGGQRGLDKATEIVADQLVQGILTADQAKHVFKTIRGISSKHESECQRKVTMREFGTAFVEKLARIDSRTETIEAQTAFLYHDRKDKIKKHREQGKINQEKADTAEAQRAARDKETALKRVHDSMTHGKTNLNEVCNLVILHFTPIGRRDKDGRYEQYAPLMTARGEPMKYETLAKSYRERYGTKRERKANAAKNQARTQAARKSKAARSKRKK